jgi:deoxyribodipyrimidine photolyase-related protein
LLSSLINIGLINPQDIINKIAKFKNKIPLNSYEGFIRQLFWREYQYYCYTYYDFKSKNYFNNQKSLDEHWYEGNVGIKPIDDAIKDAFETGYLHHIRRLMVIGNYMNLCEINPKDGFKWFMEFSCDSYEWVMHQNVYDMVFFVSGGATMRRPYMSSSNYILKMSNYKKEDWCDIWDSTYRKFVQNHKTKLWKYRYYVRL